MRYQARIKAALPWILVIAVLLLALLLPVLDDPPLRTAAYVQNLRPDGATVLRIEPKPVRRSAVVLGDGGRVLAEAGSDEYGRRHRFRFSGLEPGTRYEFEVRDGDGERIDGGSFRTAAVDDGQQVRFAVIGDSGRVPWWGWMQQSPLFHLPARQGLMPVLGPIARVGEVAHAARPDWLLHVGDVVYPKGEHRFYGPAYFQPFADLGRHAAAYLVVGNHDFLPSGGRPLLRNFELPTDPTTGDERCYTFVDGPVRVVAVDNSWICIPQGEASRRRAKADVFRFMHRELANAEEPWVVFFQHYPLMTAAERTWRQSVEMRDEVLATLRQYDVDLAFSGHDHNYQRFGRPGDQPIAIVSGGGGKSLYEELPEEAEGYGALAEAYHCCLVEIHGAVATVRAVDQYGAELDAFTIDKGALHAAGRLQLDPATARGRRTLALIAKDDGAAGPDGSGK